MQNKILIPVFTALALALGLGGCASSGKKTATARESATSETTSSTVGEGMSPGGATIGSSAADAAAAAERSLSNNIVYFDYDKAEVKAEYQAVVDAYAKYLQANPAVKVRLEGHADERGSREYNVALGERRANAVQAALVAGGVAAGQISVISFGEERPADPGHNDVAWAKNRRVQIIRQ